MPESEDMFSGLFPTGNESLDKIMLALIDPKGVTTKTEIAKPLNLARLHLFASWCRTEGKAIALTDPISSQDLLDSAQMIDDFILIYLEYMVSHKRKSRAEITAILTEAYKRERTLGEKLSSKPG